MRRLLLASMAYLADVRNGVCPADVLGNDEFDFFVGVG